MRLDRNGHAGDPSVELGRLVRGWRERLEPTSVGLIDDGRRRRPTVSQEVMAHRIGTAPNWYGRLERGERFGYSEDLLDRTANAMHLSEQERNILYLYAAGHEPATRPRPPAVTTASMRLIIDSQPWPTYLCDGSFNLIHRNTHLISWFPWLAGSSPNFLRLALTHPDARRQLYRWDTDWAVPMVAELRVASARRHDDHDLISLIRDLVRSDSVVRQLWEAGTVTGPPSPDRRQLYPPTHGQLITVEVTASAPVQAPTSQLVMLVPGEPSHRRLG